MLKDYMAGILGMWFLVKVSVLGTMTTPVNFGTFKYFRFSVKEKRQNKWME